jgi:hypothetical protein
MKRLIAFVAFIAFVGVACGPADRPVVATSEQASQDGARGAAQDLEGILQGGESVPEGEPVGVRAATPAGAVFIFGAPSATVSAQPASLRLAEVVPAHRSLEVRALASGEGIAAVYLKEVSKVKQRWGRLMTPALRMIFAAFVDDTDKDPWLVIVDDVEVTDGPDPIPITAYRWAREVVESYAACGIPPEGIDACTATFYSSSEMVFPSPRGQQVER